jgi:hypothetical protein
VIVPQPRLILESLLPLVAQPPTLTGTLREVPARGGCQQAGPRVCGKEGRRKK